MCLLCQRTANRRLMGDRRETRGRQEEGVPERGRQETGGRQEIAGKYETGGRQET